jgi:FKBP-type peptidyl-prolyl cis-trans isomerase FkpA
MRATYRLIVVVAALALAAAGCGNNTTSPSGVDQLQIVDIIVGTGAVASSGKLISVDYTGWLYDTSKVDFKGAQFDTSAGRGPFVFVLGAQQVIPGWDQGLVGMKVGGKRALTIPPNLAYGSQGVPGAIPSNSTLIFEVTLNAVS